MCHSVCVCVCVCDCVHVCVTLCVCMKLKLHITQICFSGSLMDKQKAVSKYCDSSAGLVVKYSMMSLDFSNHTGGSPTTPPLWDMMEWLRHVSTLLEEQYPFCVACHLHCASIN